MPGDGDRSMLLMAILPMMLIGTILAATVLDRRGYLGPSFRLIGVAFPLAAIAASLALASAAILFAHAAEAFAHGYGIGLYAIGAGMFHLIWAQLYFAARASWAALLGALGTAIATIGLLVFGGLPAMGGSGVYLAGFQLSLIMLLVPSIAPSLAERLAQRQMPVQRAVVLGAFGVAVIALFTCYALVGGALPAEALVR
ncbi:MAG TPA: hypothetical protein VM284_04700 [Candidatus Limnocylindria bacterium]|nr:hypothetical protein [Candidatus Limnocylindria bacterium]